MRSWVLASAVLLGWVVPASAQSGDNVLVVVNEETGESSRIADHYSRARRVPSGQILRLDGLSADPPDEIEPEEYARRIEAPIGRWLTANAAQDRIHFIVLTKGIPLRIRGTGGTAGTAASVDSELALLYRRLVGISTPVPGPLPNPYFLDSPGSQPPFTHEKFDIYLVTRLDAFTVEDALAAIDRSVNAKPDGRLLLDEKASWTDKGNVWLESAAERLRAAGFGDRVVLERTLRVATDEANLIGYYSWGSNDPRARTRNLNLRFVPGALAAMFVSTDGRTLHEPPAGWDIGAWSNKKAYFAGSPQSLAGDLIRMGATGVAGHVAEPYLGNTIRPDILFPAYVQGRTLAEAFYLAMPSVSWQTIVIGDPLCAPFPARVPPATNLDPGVDEETQMPRWLLRRRLALLSTSGRNERALRLLLKAEVLGARQDARGVRAALEQATEMDDRITGAHMQLAQMADAEGDHDTAIARYRRVVAITPDDPIALNNLAYSLAVHAGKLDEALPLAQKAYGLAPKAPAILDTLGWIQLLRGQGAEAVRLLQEAVAGAPRAAEMRFHLASAYAAMGRPDDARAELEKALASAPTLGSREEVKKLLETLRR